MNRRLDAKAALDAGLINAVFPNDQFDQEVLAVAQRLAGGPTRSFGITKRLFNQSAGMDQLDVHLDQELENLARIADSADFAEHHVSLFSCT